MGSIARGVIYLLRLYCIVDVTNIDILKLCEIHKDLICSDKMLSIKICFSYNSVCVTAMTRLLCQL